MVSFLNLCPEKRKDVVMIKTIKVIKTGTTADHTRAESAGRMTEEKQIIITDMRLFASEPRKSQNKI